MSENKHIVWKDHIRPNESWIKGIEEIRMTYGTDQYGIKVWSLYNIITNVKEGPPLKKIIDSYILELRKEKYEKLESYYDTPAYDSENKILEDEMLPKIAYFMVQLLEDEGFGFHQSTASTDSAGLDD